MIIKVRIRLFYKKLFIDGYSSLPLPRVICASPSRKKFFDNFHIKVLTVRNKRAKMKINNRLSIYQRLFTEETLYILTIMAHLPKGRAAKLKGLTETAGSAK